jgi:hypothetical protein
MGSTMTKTVAIHQPNFLPWLGFFHKWKSADAFVLLDEVQLVRRTYLTRVQILEQGTQSSINVPVKHTGTQDIPIRDALIDQSQWRPQKLISRLQYAYGKSPYWNDLAPGLTSILLQPHEGLFPLNQALIMWLGVEWLQLPKERVFLQSKLGGTGQQSELMISLTQKAGGTIYLSGGRDPNTHKESPVGAAAYNDPEAYRMASIELIYQNFSPSPYDQGGHPFVPGLSVLDALAWLGPEGTRAHLEHYGAVGK